ncbi:MAG TPA: hypothetical protein RMH99_10710, partial [Sandaracinaceae bacterium LLY-WYZ-13_1]|nr:hypothetical protein [Sandaracinaceae bacterium LLY-WYZ-13_1]
MTRTTLPLLLLLLLPSTARAQTIGVDVEDEGLLGPALPAPPVVGEGAGGGGSEGEDGDDADGDDADGDDGAREPLGLNGWLGAHLVLGA